MNSKEDTTLPSDNDRARHMIESLKIRNQSYATAMREVIRRSALLVHQNTGRWDMTVEHDKRSYDVTRTNMEILMDALDGVE